MMFRYVNSACFLHYLKFRMSVKTLLLLLLFMLVE
jgi:hypothetical protein